MKWSTNLQEMDSYFYLPMEIKKIYQQEWMKRSTEFDDQKHIFSSNHRYWIVKIDIFEEFIGIGWLKNTQSKNEETELLLYIFQNNNILSSFFILSDKKIKNI